LLFLRGWPSSLVNLLTVKARLLNVTATGM
jgi:hypothetical protein